MESAEDVSELKKEMFAWHGGAMYAAQLLEAELVTLHLILKRFQVNEVTVQELDALDEQLSRRTLGQLVRALDKQPDPAPKLAERLREYLHMRNDLAHAFFRRHDWSIMTSRGIGVMIDELRVVHEKLREADALATEVSVEFRRRMGVSEAELQTLVAEEIARRMSSETGVDE